MVGSKFYEYCAAARPVLVHGPGMAAQQVEEIGNGWSCRAGDPVDLHRTLSQLLADPERGRARGATGRQHAEEHFSKQDRHDRWESILLKRMRYTR